MFLENTVEPLLSGHPRERASGCLKEVRRQKLAFSKRYVISVQNDVKRNGDILWRWEKTCVMKDFLVATFYTVDCYLSIAGWKQWKLNLEVYILAAR